MSVKNILPSLWTAAVCAFIGGCSNGVGGSAAPLGRNLSLSVMSPARAVRVDGRNSWVSPAAASAKQVLFVSDPGTDDVYLFALPRLAEVGKLTGFKTPFGECSGPHGNVWIANYSQQELLEYSHDGRRVNKIAHLGVNPWSCAVNPRNGTIAITDFTAPNNQPGEVLLYANPSAKPVVVSNPEQYVYSYATFDKSGNLWVNGEDALEHFLLSECSSSSCSTVTLRGGSIFYAGAIVWDSASSTLVVFDHYCHDLPQYCSYPISASGVLGTPTTYLTSEGGDLCYTLNQAALARSGKRAFVVGTDNEYACGASQPSTVDRWAYPGGGTPANATVANAAVRLCAIGVRFTSTGRWSPRHNRRRI